MTPLADRFWAKVDKDGPVPEHWPELGPCWVWTGYRGNGYGQVSLGRRSEPLARSNRVAWELVAGALTSDLFVLHACDNRACVRNDDEGWYEVNGILHPRRGHLWVGTNDDNMADMVAKGRGKSAWALKTHCPGGHEYSSENTRIDHRGARHCRTCQRRYLREWRERLRTRDETERLVAECYPHAQLVAIVTPVGTEARL